MGMVKEPFYKFRASTPQQRVALLIGISLFAGLGLCPPWRVVTGAANRPADCGFRWVFSPPRLSPSAAAFYASQARETDSAAHELANEPEFYRFSVPEQKAVLDAVSDVFRALPESEKDVAIKTLQDKWAQRGLASMSKIALMWAPEIDLTRLALLWVTIATLTIGTMLLLGMRNVGALAPTSHGVMKGEFRGWRPDRIYRLQDGRRFHQIGVLAATVEEVADYDPAVTIYRSGSRWYLGIDESGDLTEVSPVREEHRGAC